VRARGRAAALALAGLVVVAALAGVLLAGAQTLPGDNALLDFAEAMRGEHVLDVVRVLTDLGSSWVAGAIAIVRARWSPCAAAPPS